MAAKSALIIGLAVAAGTALLAAIIIIASRSGSSTSIIINNDQEEAGGGGAGAEAQNPDVPQFIPDDDDDDDLLEEDAGIPDPDPEPEPEPETEPEPVDVTVQVVDGDGLVIPGATVNLGGGRTATVGGSGTVTFSLLPGSYVASVTAADTHGSSLEPHAFTPTSEAFTVPGTTSVQVSMVDYTFFEWGGSPIRHSAIRSGIANNRPVTLTYSFIPSGAAYSPGGNSYFTSMHDHQDGSTSSHHVTARAFQNEIREGLLQITAVFRAAFAAVAPNFDITWTEIMEPTSPAIPLTATHQEGVVGLFRFGMGPVGGNASTLAYAFTPADGRGEGEWCDMVFNNFVDWRPDLRTVTQDNNSYSILWVFLHEILHTLGLGHSPSGNSIMAPVAGRSFRVASRYPDGITASTGLQRMLRVLYS